MNKIIKTPLEFKFKPDLNPVAMITLGVFGGIYFNDPKWLIDLPKEFRSFLRTQPENLWNNKIPDAKVNAYKVLAGTDQITWQKAEWIKTQDPRGWFQWYVNFYYGRKSEDDARQINRWISFKARHMGMLNSHLSKKNLPNYDANKLYPVIRQGLLQWGVVSELVKY